VTARQRLSSHFTLFYKVIFPFAWIAGFAVAAVAALVVPGWAPRPMITAVAFTVAVVAGFLLFRATCFSLQKVELGPRSFFVSNYREEIEVPFADVEKVSGSVVRRPAVVQLHLRRDAGFGRCIEFMPRERVWFWAGKPHPMARELREILARARE
jgi:hypothetical protein